jgi:Mrp family chromosome partitioning ATPase
MSTQGLLVDGKLQMGVQIRGGPWRIIPLPSKDIDPALVFADEQQAVRAASYQSLADRILEDAEWPSSHRVFITSPDEGDGKTSTAFNLAWAFSTRVKPVLLVELNLARPRFCSMLGKPRIRYGVDCALKGVSTEKESVFSLVNADLHVAAIRDAMRGSEIRQLQPLFNSFLKWAEKEYQWVVLDCPPVLSRAWNSWLNVHADPALLIVRSRKTPAVDVTRASRRLSRKLRGVVLNHFSAAALSV